MKVADDWSGTAYETYRIIQKRKAKRKIAKDKEFDAYISKMVTKCMDLPRHGKRRGQP